MKRDAFPTHPPLSGPISEVERALDLTPWELSQEQPAHVVDLFQTVREEIGDDLIRQAAEVHRLFARQPALRRKWGPRILAGRNTLAEVLEAIAA